MKRTQLLLARLLRLRVAAPASAQGSKSSRRFQDFASIADSDRRRPGGDVRARQGIPGPSLRRREAVVHPEAVAGADLLIVAGLELEIGYLPPLIDQSRNDKIHPGSAGYLDASIGCDILQRPTTQVTRAMGDVHPYGNPHYWTDPDNGRSDRPRDRLQALRARSRRQSRRTTRTSPPSSPSSPRKTKSGSRRWPLSPARRS